MRNLKENRLRNLVMVISIITMVTMVTFLEIWGTSTVENMKREYVKRNDISSYVDNYQVENDKSNIKAENNRLPDNIEAERMPYRMGALMVLISGLLIIYNILQISVQSDIKLYGRIKSIGGTSRQIRREVYHQVYVLSLISVPIGLLLGYQIGAVAVPCLLSDSITEASVYYATSDFLIAAVSGCVTVLLAAFGPARTAGKVSSTEIIHEENNFSFHRTQRRYPGMPVLFQLSLTNLSRHRRRTAVVICSLTLGLVMLCIVHIINNSFDEEKYMNEFAISDYSITSKVITNNQSENSQIPEEELNRYSEQVKSMGGIVNNGSLYAHNVLLDVNKETCSEIIHYYEQDKKKILKDMSYDDKWIKGYYQLKDTQTCVATVLGMDGLIVDRLSEKEKVLKGSIDKEKFFSGKYVIAEGINDPDNKNMNATYSVGDEVVISGKKFIIMAVVEAQAPVDEVKNFNSAGFVLPFYLPVNAFQQLFPDDTIIKFFFDVNDEGKANIKNLLENNKFIKNFTVTSQNTLIEKYKEESKNSIIMQIFIALLIVGFGILNFINAMITAIRSRRKEFTLIQSIGMTRKQLSCLLIFEGLDYAVITLFLSFFISVTILNLGMHAYINSQWTATYNFSILPLIIATPLLLVLAIVVPLLCINILFEKGSFSRLDAKVEC